MTKRRRVFLFEGEIDFDWPVETWSIIYFDPREEKLALIGILFGPVQQAGL